MPTDTDEPEGPCSATRPKSLVRRTDPHCTRVDTEYPHRCVPTVSLPSGHVGLDSLFDVSVRSRSQVVKYVQELAVRT